MKLKAIFPIKGIICSLLFFAAHFSGSFSQGNNPSLISQIENHLIPTVIVKDETVEYYTIDERMEHYKTPGLSMAFIDNGKIEWAKTYGYLSNAKTKQTDTLTLFQAGSISKPVAAMAALCLVDNGNLDLDRGVNEFLEAWKIPLSQYTDSNPVTIRYLLSHSAGTTQPGFGGYAVGAELPSLLEILNGEKPANTGKIKVDTVPGSVWQYSGGGYVIVQKILEDVSNLPFPNLVDSVLFPKLSMNKSTFEQPLPSNYFDNASSGHLSNGSRLKGNWKAYPEQAAAGLWTTPRDLCKFMIGIQKSFTGYPNQILSQKIAKEMLTNQINHWGLGLQVEGIGDSLIFSHKGFNTGYISHMLAFANMGQGVVIMVNSNGGGPLIYEILRGVSDIYGWDIYKPVEKKVIKLKSKLLEPYTGNYRYKDGSQIDIFARNNALFVRQSWDNDEYQIFPESKMVFFEKKFASQFIFEKGKNNKITGFMAFNTYKFKKEG